MISAPGFRSPRARHLDATGSALHPPYYRSAFDHNWGWRIEHILATAPLAERCRAADVDLEPRRAEGASDHAVMWAEFDRQQHRLGDG